ncbi:hypothetical protein SKDZ_08G2230 [Saccharomyces kudriavzevii ZP591]|nr:hypothetical protein SKDZ_08G2230 [Saccharomyces kudriavzevii ZP591]
MLGISPTCYGCIDNEEDLALVIQGVFDGNLRCIERRPYEAEKAELVGSGNIFVFNEERSGIKRWTDGFSWSPSRISGKFLVYREYNKLGSTQDTSLHTVLDYNIFERSHQKYVYTGLLKKTFSLKYCIDPTDGSKLETFHLVAYYKEQDIHQGSLKRPSENPFFNKFQPSQKLTDALKKVAVGNGRSNPTRSSERDRAKLQNTGMRRSLSSSSTYNDFVKNNAIPPRNIPTRMPFFDGRGKIQTPSSFRNITEDQHQRQREYAFPMEKQNQLPIPYAQHPPQPLGIYSARYQPGLRRTVSQPVIFCSNFNPPQQQPMVTSCEGRGVTPLSLVYSSKKFHAIPYQNLDPYYSRSGPECISPPAPIPSNMMPPVHSILVHDYSQQKIITSSNVAQPPHSTTATSTATKNSDGIYILPAPRMNVPPPAQYPMTLARNKTHNSPPFSKDSASTDQDYHPRYSK